MMTKKILTVVMAVFLLSACKKKDGDIAPDSKIDKDQAKTEIEALQETYSSFVNTKNTDGIASFYAEDARIYRYGKPVAAGRNVILETLKKDYASLPEGIKIDFSTKEILVSDDGGQAVEVGSFKISDSTDVSVATGHYFNYFEKRNGKYVCVRGMVTPDTPIKEIVEP